MQTKKPQRPTVHTALTIAAYIAMAVVINLIIEWAFAPRPVSAEGIFVAAAVMSVFAIVRQLRSGKANSSDNS